MAIQSAEASNLDSGKTRSAAYRCSQTRPPTAELPHGYVAWTLTTLFLRSSGHFNIDPACRTGVLVRRLQLNGTFDEMWDKHTVELQPVLSRYRNLNRPPRRLLSGGDARLKKSWNPPKEQLTQRVYPRNTKSFSPTLPIS